MFSKWDQTIKATAIATLLAVMWLSFSPDPLQGTKISPLMTSLAHVVMHFVLASVFLIAWRRRIGAVLVFLAAIAVIAELGQLLSPQRTVEMLDIIGNFVGFSLGYFFFTSLRQFARRAPY